MPSLAKGHPLGTVHCKIAPGNKGGITHMKFVLRLVYIIDLINEWIGRIFSFLIIALMLLVVEEVIARYFFRSPHDWGLELSGFLFLITICLGGGYTLLHGGHVKVDIIYLLFPARVKAIVDLFTYIIVICLAFVLIRYGGESFLRAFTSHAVSFSGWQVILWPFRLFVPIAGMLLGLQALAKWIRDWITAVTGVKMESKVVHGEGGIRG